MLRLVQITVGAVVLCFGASSSAADIRWSGDDSCRRESEVSAQVEAATGRPNSSVEIADFELRVKSLSRTQWSLELTTVRRADQARSTRTIHGATCAEVTDAAAVAIALAIGPSRAEPNEELEATNEDDFEPVEPEPAKASASTTQQPRTSQSRQPRASHSSLEWLAGLSAALDSSATPSPALGGSARFALGWLPADRRKTAVRFELEGAFYAPTQTDSVANQAGQFQLAYGALLLCGAKPLAETALLICAGAELGQLSGEGVAVTTSHPASTLWSAVRAEVGLEYPHQGALRMFGRGGIAMPLIRREFVLDGPDVVFRTAAISARVSLGVQLSL